MKPVLLYRGKAADVQKAINAQAKLLEHQAEGRERYIIEINVVDTQDCATYEECKQIYHSSIDAASGTVLWEMSKQTRNMLNAMMNHEGLV